jgi:uncharacterized protein YfcZ (UPF0381/DUF406 family)
MATLTWRNVDNPNFTGAMAGYRSSAEMLNNAFDNLRQGLGDFQAQRTADADSQVLANSLQFSDPAAYQEALKSGAILGGIDPTRVSSQTMGALASRAGTLINNSANEYDLNRAKETNAAMDAARPALVAIAEANASGDPAKIAAAQQQYGPQLANLPAADILKTYLTGQSLESGSLRNDATRFTNDTTVRNDEDTQAATALVNQIRENNITVDGARQELLAADLSAGARSKATELLGGMFPGMFGPIGSTPGAAPGGSSGGSAAYDTVVGNGQFGSPSQPLSSMSIGQAIEFGQNVLIPGTRGNRQLGLPADKGSSAMGAFQITQETLQDYAPKALGSDWQKQPMSAANQDKIAEAIFNDRKQGNLADTWVSLPDKTPGAYAGKSWEEMRQVIARGEVGMELPGIDDLLAASANEVAAAQGQLGSRVMSNNAADGAAQDLVNNFGSNATVGSVTDQLVKGDFAGADANKVRNQIRSIMQMSASKEYGGTGSPSINAAQAGAILQRSIATSDPLAADGNTGFTSSWFADEVGVSDDDVAAAVRNFNSGGSLDAALENQQVAQVSQMLTQAQQASQGAMNDLVQAARRAQSQPGARDELPQFIQRVQQSNQRVQRLLDRQRSSSQFQANRAAPPNQILPTEEELQAFQTWGRY